MPFLSRKAISRYIGMGILTIPTWDDLITAYRIGQGQHLPNRLFWARAEDE